MATVARPRPAALNLTPTAEARIAELIALLAAHTPETLPKRPTIEILHG